MTAMIEIPYGYCYCTCGEKTTVARKTNRAQGQIKGEPNRFLPGHQNRKRTPQYEERDLGYETPCWFWLWSPDTVGYGHLRSGGKLRPAHVVYYEAAKGPIPAGLELDHLCHTEACDKRGRDCLHRRCVNPDHLRAIPHTENVRRGRNTKLTLEQVRDIRSRPWVYGSGIALAREFGVHPDRIHRIRNGRAWKDR